MLNLVSPAPAISPIDPTLASFVNAVLIADEAGTLEATFRPTVKPTAAQSTPVRHARKATDKLGRKAIPTTNTDHSYIRLVACELALMDAYADSPVDGYSLTSDVPTLGDVDAAYRALMPFVKAVEISFGRNSAHYAEAAALVA